MQRTIAPLLRLALCLLALLSSPQGLAEETASAVAPLPAAASQERPLVVLKDGTHIEPQRVTRTPTTILLKLTDGQTRIYRLDDVDLDASVGVPPQVNLKRARPRPNGPTRRTSLSTVAGTTSLQVPEANAVPDDGITLLSAGRKQGTGGAEETEETKEPATGNEPIGDDDAPGPLRDAMRAVSNAWQEYRSAMSMVKRRCRGNSTGRVGSSCGGTSVVAARHTAPCRDAVNQALSRLDTVEQRYSQVWSVARRVSCSPGTVREQLAVSGLDDTRRRAASQRASLDALSADVRSEP